MDLNALVDFNLVATHGGYKSATAAVVVSRRTFAGYWEYLLENAIFTSPPISEFGGAEIGRAHV